VVRRQRSRCRGRYCQGGVDQLPHLGCGEPAAYGVPGQPALASLVAQRQQLQRYSQWELTAVDHLLHAHIEVQ